MRLFVRVVGGIAAVSLAGFLWTSVDERDVMPESRTDSPADTSIAEPVRDRATAPIRPTRNSGGLPARGARTGSTGSTAGTAAAAQRTFTAPVAPALPSPPSPTASKTPARAGRDVAAVPAANDTAGSPSTIVEPNAPLEKERSRSSGIGGSVLEKSGAPALGLPVGLKPRRVFNGPAAPPQTTTTDGRGRFAFSAVADGEYEIATEKTDRYERASTVVRSGSESTVLIVEPAAESALSIRGVVDGTGGGPLAGVRIEAIGRSSLTATTDARGAYTLRVPADSRVEQTALRFRRDGYRDRRWTIADGLRSSEYEVIGNVRLEPDAAGVPVTGMVTSTSGTPVTRAQVQLTSAARSRAYRAVTDAAGRFTLTNVEAGADYRVWVRPHSGFKDGLLENVVVDAGTQLEVQLTPIGVGTLKGRLVTPDGAPVPGFTMFLSTANAAGARSPSVTSDGEGRFLVAGLPEGRVALQTRAAPALSVTGIELSAGAPDADVTVVVDVGPHRFDGRLLTSDGSPAAGVSVSLEWSAATGSVTSRSLRQTVTDAEGNFAFTQLGRGVHVVSAALAGAGSARLEHAVGAAMEPALITLPGKRGRQ